MQRDEVIIRDMINALQLGIEFGEGFNKDSFIRDWKMKTSTTDVPDLLDKMKS